MFNPSILSKPMSRRTFGAGTALSLAAIGVLRTLPALAHDHGTDAPSLQTLDIVTKDYAFSLPESIPAGFTTITIENHGSEMHHAMFIHLNDGVTLDQLMAASDFTAMSRMGSSLGGPMADPGQKSSVVIDLKEGNYAIICVIPGPDGMPHYLMGMASAFKVTAPTSTSTGAAPAADLKVELMEMMFHNLSAKVAAGPAVWEIANAGYAMHEMIVVRLADGVTGDMIMAMLAGPPPGEAAATPGASPDAAPAGPPPFTVVGGVAPMNPGNTAYASLELEAGEHLAFCMIPDPETGAPHAAMGMAMPFTVE